MVGREQRPHGDRLVDAAEGLVEEVRVQVHRLRLLCLNADRGHGLDGLDRIAAGSGLGRQHHCIGAIEHGVGDIRHLGTRRHRVDDHRLHHLRSRDGQLVGFPREPDHALLQRRHGRVAHFHGQVTARHHDAVGRRQDLFQHARADGLGALDLGDHLGLVVVRRTGHGGQLARHFHVGGVLGETDRDVVGAQRHRGLDVVHVLGRQRRRRQPAALAVDALVVGQVAADLDDGLDLLAHHALDLQHDQAVVEQQQVTGADVARQLLVIQADALLVAQLAASIQREAVAGVQRDLAALELADADLRALQIGHDADLAAHPTRRLAHQLGACHVVLRGAVREIQPHHVDPRRDHARQDLQRIGRRAERSDDLGGAGHGRMYR